MRLSPVIMFWWRKSCDVAAVERGHRLADADDQAAEQGQRERLEAAEQRGAEPGNRHHEREGRG